MYLTSPSYSKIRSVTKVDPILNSGYLSKYFMCNQLKLDICKKYKFYNFILKMKFKADQYFIMDLFYEFSNN